MTFEQLGRMIDGMTEEQRKQEVWFIEPFDNPSLHVPELLIAQQDILASTFDVEMEGDDRVIVGGMPYLG